jgi:hypothetical protein
LNDPVKLREMPENVPLGRLGKSEDVAAIASLLASENSDCVMGTALFVTRLVVELPGTIDNRVAVRKDRNEVDDDIEQWTPN